MNFLINYLISSQSHVSIGSKIETCVDGAGNSASEHSLDVQFVHSLWQTKIWVRWRKNQVAVVVFNLLKYLGTH